jgi:hypothetical protein
MDLQSYIQIGAAAVAFYFMWLSFTGDPFE